MFEIVSLCGCYEYRDTYATKQEPPELGPVVGGAPDGARERIVA